MKEETAKYQNTGSFANVGILRGKLGFAIRAAKIIFVIATTTVTGNTAQDTTSRTSFTRETIDVTIGGDNSFRVTGTYHFTGRPNTKYPIVYPFPIDANHGKPMNIELLQDSSSLTFASSEKGDALRFYIRLDAGGRGAFTITYEQKTKEPSGTYILTSTEAWNKPLEHAVYRVTVPDSILLEHLNWSIDTVYQRSTNLVYALERENIMPARDLVFRWKKSE